MNKLHPHTITKGELKVQQLCCNSCGKSVSSPFIAIQSETPYGGLVIRAFIECPECIEKKPEEKITQ